MNLELARVIRPMTMTPATIDFTNVPEDDYVPWVPGTYPVDTWVRHNNHIWQALRETDKEPSVENPNDWNDGGFVNRYLMIDGKVGTQTVNKGGIVVEITAHEFIDSIALLNIFANSIKVTVTDPQDGVIYYREMQTYDAGVKNWWQYFFKKIVRRSDAVFDDIPLYAGVLIRIELIVPEDVEARLGELIIGAGFEIGYLRWGSSVGIKDWSIKDFDQFGNVSVTERSFSKRPEFDLSIDTPRVDEVLEELTKLRAVPAVYIGHSTYTSTIAYGFYRELTIVLAYPSISNCTLTIEALT